MRQPAPLLRRLYADERGAYTVELALVILPLTLILLVMTDFGYRLYLGSVVEGALQRTARYATIGTRTSTDVDAYFKKQLIAFGPSVTVKVDRKSYLQFSGVGKEEKYVDSTPAKGYDKGIDCYFDDNGDGVWNDASSAGRTGLGGSDDVVYYTATASFPRIVPLTKFLGFSAAETVTSTMVFRNQPFGSQAFPSCKI